MYVEDSWDAVTRGRVVDPTISCAKQGLRSTLTTSQRSHTVLLVTNQRLINDQCPLITNCTSSALLQSVGTCGTSGTSGTSGTHQ